MRLTGLLTLLLGITVAALADEPPAAEPAPPPAIPTVRTVDGRTVRGAIERIDADRVVVKTADKTETLARADLSAIEFSGKPPANLADSAGRHILVLHDGSRLALGDSTIADGKLAGRSNLVGEVSVALDRVACLLRPVANERVGDVERQFEALRLAPDAKDHVAMARKTGPWVVVDGVVKSADSKTLTFSYEGTEALLESDSVRAIQFARVKLDLPRAGGLLLDTEGNRLAFASLQWADGKLHAATPCLGDVSVDAGRLAGVRFANDRLVYLSDLAPVEVKQTGFFGEAMGWRKDRAIGGLPLRLGGTTYEKGLGLHSRTELVYDLGGQYRQFSALAGIDESSRFGSAFVTVTGDGKPLLEKTRLARQDAPRPLSLPVTGVKRLTILVDFGEGSFGVGERVDLADAKLVK